MQDAIVITLIDKNQEINKQRGAIRRLIGRLTLTGNWVFPDHEAGDGCMGTLCVSQYQTLIVPNATKQLALHITFQLPHLLVPSINGLKRKNNPATVTVTVQNLHLTARPKQVQMTISDINASSILDAQTSFHRGTNNDWSYKDWDEDRLKALAATLQMASNTKATILADLNAALLPYSALPLVMLVTAGTDIVNGIQAQIAAHLEDARVAQGIPNPVGVVVTRNNW